MTKDELKQVFTANCDVPVQFLDTDAALFAISSEVKHGRHYAMPFTELSEMSGHLVALMADQFGKDVRAYVG